MGIVESPLVLAFAAIPFAVGAFIGVKLVTRLMRAVRQAAETNGKHSPTYVRASFAASDSISRAIPLLQLLVSPFVAILVFGFGAPKLIGWGYLGGILLTGAGLALSTLVRRRR